MTKFQVPKGLTAANKEIKFVNVFQEKVTISKQAFNESLELFNRS